MIIRVLLAIIAWGGIITLELVLMEIARFFEQSSGEKTRYRLYLIPVLLTFTGTLIYLWRLLQGFEGPNFTGNPAANVCLFVAGLWIFLLGSHLQDQMTRNPQR
ncbi:MAG: hypothetical protein JXB35_16015 [Anaerolineae bacterium]|nr:hypothetical protein [Anaerolineae bacterium]